MVIVGRQNRSKDGAKLVLRHTKNKSETTIRILPPFAVALDGVDHHHHLTYLVTEFGKPFTAAGFGNRFRERCNLAGLPHCSAHGLRKVMARRLAEAGATTLEGRAVTGHKSDAMFAHMLLRPTARLWRIAPWTAWWIRLDLANYQMKVLKMADLSQFLDGSGSPSWIRTNGRSINSRELYR